MPIWTVYSHKILDIYAEYVWVCGDVIIHHRSTAPFGWLPKQLNGLPAKRKFEVL